MSHDRLFFWSLDASYFSAGDEDQLREYLGRINVHGWTEYRTFSLRAEVYVSLWQTL